MVLAKVSVFTALQRIHQHVFLIQLRNMSTERLASVLGVSTVESSNNNNKRDGGKPNTLLKNKSEKPILRRDKIQQTVKKKATPFLPGTVNLQILGAGANGAPCAVYLFTDQSRYLFNCGEGTQRLAHEHKTKLARLEQIFLTRNTWPMIGGVPGLALTVQDAGVRELGLYGPPDVDKILASMKRFVVLKNLQIKTIDCTEKYDFEDSVMTVKCLPLYRNNSEASKDVTSHHDKVVIAYVCCLKPRPGALNLEKCVEHGVPPGPLLGMLKNGMDVTLENGKVVRSKDVSEPNEIAQAFLFIDIPSEDFLPALEANAEEFCRFNSKTDCEVVSLIHFSPETIVENNRYRNFMQKFPEKTHHIFLNSKANNFSGYTAAHRIQYQLNQLNENLFPLLAESKECALSTCISNTLKKTKLVEEPDTTNGMDHEAFAGGVNSLASFHLRPKKGLDRTAEASLNPNEYIQETQILPEFPGLLKNLKQEMSQLDLDNTRNYPKITFLGTGSCIPNKTRNVSAILMETQPDRFMLMDCGEGTLGQIIRFFGKAKAESVIRNLKSIYISHLHADHHIGLIALLNERQRLLCKAEEDEGTQGIEKLLLFAPIQIQPWLQFYNREVLHIRDAYELIGNGELLDSPFEPQVDRNIDVGFQAIRTCLVRHCPHSFGVRIEIKSENDSEPLSVTYSGDTMPCGDLIDLGYKTTILIHEATMEDDLLEEARLKMHSTIRQAISQGQAMEAEHIILTHFSQRYAKLPRMQTNADAEDSSATTDNDAEGDDAEQRKSIDEKEMRNVSIAFDNMHATLVDLKHFHLLYPSLRALFAEHAEELEQKALKRELKLERKRKLEAE